MESTLKEQISGIMKEADLTQLSALAVFKSLQSLNPSEDLSSYKSFIRQAIGQCLEEEKKRREDLEAKKLKDEEQQIEKQKESRKNEKPEEKQEKAENDGENSNKEEKIRVEDDSSNDEDGDNDSPKKSKKNEDDFDYEYWASVEKGLPPRRARQAAAKPKRRRSATNSENKPNKKRASDAPKQRISSELESVIGVPEINRWAAVRELWNYIKLHDLQDPKNRKMIICDEKLQKVFKKKKVSMLQLNPGLSRHFLGKEEE